MRVHWSIFLSAPGTVRLLIYCKLDEYKIVLNCGFNLPFPDYWLGGTCFHLFINLVTFSLTCLFISFGYFPIELFFFLFLRILDKFWIPSAGGFTCIFFWSVACLFTSSCHLLYFSFIIWIQSVVEVFSVLFILLILCFRKLFYSADIKIVTLSYTCFKLWFFIFWSSKPQSLYMLAWFISHMSK